MRTRKTRGASLCTLVVALAVLSAGCSKANQSTTSLTTTLPPAKSIDGWSAQQLPNPGGATNALLSGISCSSDTSCTVVGAYGKSTGQFFPVVEHWNGSTWSIQAGASAATAAPSRLLAISCPSTMSCFAVGELTTGSNSQAALVERWDGSSWKDVPVPAPKNASARELTSISCFSSIACTAVGSYRVPPSGATEVLLERWNGLKWALQTAPVLPRHVTSITLSQVSCSSSRVCIAVGQSTSSSGAAALAEYWNGTTWTIQALPVLQNRGGSKLAGVSCVSPTDCTAVGDAIDSAGLDVSVAEHWNGRHWVVEPTPSLPRAELALSAVSCPTANSCTAVGRQTISIYSGSGWTVQRAPVPSAVAESDLSGPSAVSCTVSGACTATGVTISVLGVATMLVAHKS